MDGTGEIIAAEVWHVRVWRRYKESWFDRHFRFSTPLSVVAFIGALMVNFWAISQATTRAGAAVPDIILSNIPVFEVDGLFVYGTVIVVAVSVWLVFTHPKRIPYALHALTLFILIRSAFVLMTHLGAPQAAYESDFGETINNAFFGSDQFFSAHTGMPLLGALGFWHIPRIRNFFLASSVFFAVVVLAGHIHYTIDVFSAFFITYGIYHLSLYLFPKERALFLAADNDNRPLEK